MKPTKFHILIEVESETGYCDDAQLFLDDYAKAKLKGSLESQGFKVIRCKAQRSGEFIGAPFVHESDIKEVVLVGDIFDGFKAYGPFEEYGDTKHALFEHKKEWKDKWHVIEVSSVYVPPAH